MMSKPKLQRLQTLLPILSRQLERQICAHSFQLGHNGQLWRGFVTEEKIIWERLRERVSPPSVDESKSGA